MTDILADLRSVVKLNGDTYSSMEVLDMVGRAANEIDRLRAALKELIPLAVNPYDGSEYEKGEMPALDRAREIVTKAEGKQP